MDAELIERLRDRTSGGAGAGSEAEAVGPALLADLTRQAHAAHRSDSSFDPIRASAALRRQGLPPELIAAALTQATLRVRGQTKFGPSALEMFFTPDGLEQATRPSVADRHAQRLRAAGAARVLDLGCGIGADAMAFLRAGLTVEAIERDPGTAAIARANLQRGAPGQNGAALVRCAEAGAVLAALPQHRPGASTDTLWFDPARRTPGVADSSGRTRRTFRLEELAPSWDLVRTAAAQAHAAGAKLSPSFPHREIPDGAQAEWVSFGGELLECVIWWGAAATRPGRSAAVHTAEHGWVTLHEADTNTDTVADTVASSGADPEANSETEANVEPNSGPATRPVGTKAARPRVRSGEKRPGHASGGIREWVYEADPAVRAAGLIGQLRSRTGGQELEPNSGWVTSAEQHTTPLARRYRVIDTFAYRPKTFRAWVRGQRLGELTIKTRGAGIDANQLWRSTPLTGDHAAVVLITRVGGRLTVLHVQA